MVEAERLYLQARARDPDNRNANWNLAIIWLMQGDFRRGWQQFEWRKRLQSVVIDFGRNEGEEWDGTPLCGRSILLHTEQGVGDAIQFVRYAEELRRVGAGRVCIETPGSVASILRRARGVDEVVARGEPLPTCDVYAELMGLPRLLGTTLETVPAAVPYLKVEPREAACRVGAPSGVRKVGIAWAGNPQHRRDILRSVDAARFSSLVALPGHAFYSLQKGSAAEAQLAHLPAGSVIDLAPHLGDLLDTAAVIERLDLVITVDTSIAHLAGALGRPVWLLLPHVADYRWLLDRTDSPWYPTMRIFRQPAVGDWDSVFDAVARALRDEAVPSPRPVRRSPAPGTASLSADETPLESATCRRDGTPAFMMGVPIASLADAGAFSQYETELVGTGQWRAVRELADELLQTDDLYIDLEPGLGLAALSALVSPARPRAIVVLADDREREVFGRNAWRAAAQDRVTVVPSSGTAASSAASHAATRFFVRATHARAAMDFIAHLDALGAGDRLAALCVSEPDVAERAMAIDAMRGRGAIPLTVDWSGEVVLDPIEQFPERRDVVFFSPDLLRDLLADQEQRDADGRDDAEAAPAQRTPLAAAAAAITRIGLDWEVRQDTGWGVYGMNLVLQLARTPGVQPSVFAADLGELPPLERAALGTVIREGAGLSRVLHESAGKRIRLDGIMLRALGNNFGHGPLWSRVLGHRNVGIIFFEDPAFDAAALERARSLDLIVAGSAWNGDVLRAAGLDRVRVVQQGVDPTIFHPAPRARLFGDRFVIFSGGKLEYRKGQDIVIAAFRRFRERHPEALLVTAWHNAWPQLIADLGLAGHVRGVPGVRNGVIDVTTWLEQNGRSLRRRRGRRPAGQPAHGPHRPRGRCRRLHQPVRRWHEPRGDGVHGVGHSHHRVGQLGPS